MKLAINEITSEDYLQKVTGLVAVLPIWLQPTIISCYSDKLILTATTGSELKAIWVVPLIIQGETKLAKRKYRFLPYASPLIFEKDNLKRREIMAELFDYLRAKVESVYLPLSVGFVDSTMQSQGALVEWRHTHLLSRPLDFERIDSRLRNHIRFAKNNVEMVPNDRVENFKFEIAIKGSEEEVEQRRKSSLNIYANQMAYITSAKVGNELCAGVFIAFDGDTAYLMHSWQLETTPRGTISALIFEAINWTFHTKKLKHFDFEGSLINNIDYFFSGFNADVTPYGFVHWSIDKTNLFSLIDRSLQIEGRLINDNYKIR
jgi:hypothetical protein